MSKEIDANKEAKVEVEVEVDNNENLSKLQEELEEQKKKTDEYYEYLQRNMAEFDNYKKRIAKEKDSLYLSISCDIVEKILPVMDNFEKAIKSECKDESYKEGMVMIFNQLNEMLKNMGVNEEGKIGQEFDPNLHEAVMHEENEEYGEKVITEVYRKGYVMNGKVVRHAMVKVAN